MFIEALSVCVGYSDFLAQTLPRNVGLFDHVVVVTSFADRDTQALCKSLSVECRCTDLFDKPATSMQVPADGEPVFSKGRAIDWGLGFLEKTDWICHLDADIYLPPRSRQWIEAACPDEDCIYGCDRVNCVGYDAWARYLQEPNTHHQLRHGCLLTPPPFPLGARLFLPDQQGYVPIGFFTLWHAKHGRRYPVRHTSCEHTDLLHALQWPRDKRRLLTAPIAIHLESEPSRMGANWQGRTTRPFESPRSYVRS